MHPAAISHITLTHADMRTLYEPLMTKIVALVDGQKEAAAQHCQYRVINPQQVSHHAVCVVGEILVDVQGRGHIQAPIAYVQGVPRMLLRIQTTFGAQRGAVCVSVSADQIELATYSFVMQDSDPAHRRVL
ncbi:hypothetical protein BDW74DRAFT_182074 [Aspergillus multicolor]|uniref:uncharacterized protein n=1 Tax=Aspergillus multicolor TaxID=41759 RepID=UPI003CCE266B